MSNPLQPSGAQAQKPTRFAPLWSNEFFSGLWTQRSPLRDAATPFLYGKFYGATRYESLIDGLNVEISPRLTLIRRPGNSVYNSQTFTDVTRFYDFRAFSDDEEIIHTIVDTAAAVYDGTGPATQLLLKNKQPSAGKTSFVGVGENLYMGDGTATAQWQQSVSTWQPYTVFDTSNFIVDTNNSIQKSLGLTAAIVDLQLNDNILTVDYNSSLQLFNVGDTINLIDLTVAPQFNDLSFTVVTAAAGTLTAAVGHPGLGIAFLETGYVFNTAVPGTTGGTQPTWNSILNDVTLDGTQGWRCRGSSVMNWGLKAPLVAPVVANAVNTTYPVWAANTYYNPGLTIVDSNGNIQTLTHDGTAGGMQPSWNATPGGTTTDGGATWTNGGTATRQTNHAYAVGDLISVSWSQTITVDLGGAGAQNSDILLLPNAQPGNDTGLTKAVSYSYVVTFTDIFKCIIEGRSSASATGVIPWVSGTGSTVSDGTVMWQNAGVSSTWLTANGGASLASTPLVLETQIVDSNGNLQTITVPGVTGATAPAWSNVLGGTTVDNTATWSTGTAVEAGNSFPWVYGYTFASTVTEDESSMSPISSPIVLQAGNFIQISGSVSTEIPADVVRIYRSVQNTTAPLFRLAEIPLPLRVGSNIIPDSDGTALTWTFEGQGMTFVANDGANTGGAWEVTGVGLPLIASAFSTPFVVVPGNTYTFSAYSQHTGASGGTPVWSVLSADRLTSYASFSGYVATPFRQSVTFTVPGGVTQVVIGVAVAGTTPSAGAVLTFSNPQFESGGSATVYRATSPLAGGGNWNYADTSTDLDLNQFIEGPIAGANNPPLQKLNHLTFHLDRVFGAVGRTVYYSGGPDTLTGNGNSAFPPLSKFTYPSAVTKLWPSTFGLLVFTTADIYVISGQGTQSSILFSAPYLPGSGLLSEDCFAMSGSLAYIFTSDRQLLTLDPASGLAEPGFPIGDQLKNFDPKNAYLAWLINGDDKGLFIADGSTGWFRLNPTPAPEVGYTWSPKATIVAAGGCGAIGVSEITPGNRRLLVGPINSGPILERDLSVNSDDGVAYGATATAGSIVQAVPGQIAVPVFVAADEIAVGTKVGIGVLLDEINGTFLNLSRAVNDPPGFAPSSSLYSNRYYLSETGEPQECRHMQVKFTWIAEDHPNELLSFTLFAGFYQEA